jgi:hypothetical protein
LYATHSRRRLLSACYVCVTDYTPFAFFLLRCSLCILSNIVLHRHRYACRSRAVALGTPHWTAHISICTVHCRTLSIRNVVKSCVGVHSCRVCTAASHSLCNVLRTKSGNSKAPVRLCSKQRTAFPLEGLHAHSRHCVVANAFPAWVCIFPSCRLDGIWHGTHCNTAPGKRTQHRPLPHGGHAVFQLCILPSISLCLCLLSSLLW